MKNLPAAQENSGAKMIHKILVVDYSLLRQQMYRHVMGRYNCAIVTASNCKDALSLLAEQKDVRLILLDINIAMTGMTGSEFFLRAEELGVIPKIPVILISSAGEENETHQFLEFGIKDILKRPFNPVHLHKIIEKIFSSEDEGISMAKISFPQEGTTTMSTPTPQVVSGRVYWRGELNQSMSLRLGEELLRTLKGCETLTLNLEEVERMDYSCLVLLCAVKRQAGEYGKRICLEGQENQAIDPLLQRFRNNGNRLCRSHCGNSCLFD